MRQLYVLATILVLMTAPVVIVAQQAKPAGIVAARRLLLSPFRERTTHSSLAPQLASPPQPAPSLVASLEVFFT
jgi:hypothetical protein